MCKGFQITTSKWQKKEIKQTNKQKPRTKTKKIVEKANKKNMKTGKKIRNQEEKKGKNQVRN